MRDGNTARSASPATRSTVAERRRRLLLGALLAFLLALIALLGARHRIAGEAPAVPRWGRPAQREARHSRADRGYPRAARHSRADRGYPRALIWPRQGQGALALAGHSPAASPHERPVPIASLAKVMTAYLVLERYPLRGLQEGFTITVSAAQAQAEARDASAGGSVVRVRAGEELSERQLLEALLIPSGNNIAELLAVLVAGSEQGFLAEMNEEASALGMRQTLYTDPSGFDPSTVSTAADQLRVLQRAMRYSVFREVVSTSRVTLPVAGTVENFNPLIAEGYGGKTGSDREAGGCLAFFTEVTLGGRAQTVAGVVLGQGEGSDTSEILSAAGEAAVTLVDSMRTG